MSYHIYVSEKDVAANYSRYLNHRHYIIDKFLIEHQVRVLDVTKCKYFQTRDNRSGMMVLEIELEDKYTEPVDSTRMLKALEESSKKSVPKK